jgi:hypothetical protein
MKSLTPLTDIQLSKSFITNFSVVLAYRMLEDKLAELKLKALDFIFIIMKKHLYVRVTSFALLNTIHSSTRFCIWVY